MKNLDEQYIEWLLDLQKNAKVESIEDLKQLYDEILERKDEVEDAFNNMSIKEQDSVDGQLLEHRINALSGALNDIQNIIDSEYKTISKELENEIAGILESVSMIESL